ncbi:MAG: hypothetical protein WC969_07060 [Elusimicrobiota bacterium]|jgi:hypothetical protein
MRLRRLEPFQARLRAMCFAQFPRRCGNCRREYKDLSAYLAGTTPLAADAESGGSDTLGIFSYADCPCGSTLSLRWEGFTPEERILFRSELALEAREAGRGAGEILVELGRQLLRAGVR